MLLSTSLSHKYRLKRSGLLCTNHNGCRESPEFTKKIRKNCQYLKYTTILFSSSRRVHLFVINCSVNETFTLPFNQSFYRSSSCACRVRYCFFPFLSVFRRMLVFCENGCRYRQSFLHLVWPYTVLRSQFRNSVGKNNVQRSACKRIIVVDFESTRPLIAHNNNNNTTVA